MLISAEVDARLAGLGLAWPVPPQPVAAYVPSVRTGNLLFISGQLPFVDGKLTATGKVPVQVSLEQAQSAAARAALNALAVLRAELGGDWSRLVRIVRVGVFLAASPEFTESAKVANGASELLATLLGEAGRHARAAVGVAVLPLDAPVEVEVIAELQP